MEPTRSRSKLWFGSCTSPPSDARKTVGDEEKVIGTDEMRGHSVAAAAAAAAALMHSRRTAYAA